MSTASILPCATGGVFDKLLSKPDFLIEGAIWTGWFGWTVSDLSTALNVRQEACASVETTAQKTDKLWDANKKLFLAICACFSSSSMIVAWAETVGVLIPGPFGALYGVLGYGGSALSSLIRLGDAIQEIGTSAAAYDKADHLTRENIALGLCPKMAAIAFYVCAVAWGVFGAAHLVVGGAQLALLVNKFLNYTILTCLGYLGTAITIPLFMNQIPQNQVQSAT